jgi:hypothetical protein
MIKMMEGELATLVSFFVAFFVELDSIFLIIHKFLSMPVL